MLELANARIVDPLHPQNGKCASLFVAGQQFVDPPGEPCRQRIDLAGGLVMSGGIDIHTHIGGGKVNLARMLMARTIAAEERTVWPTIQTGQMYARMGYTACFEPAMLLSSARHTHAELSDTPLLDHGAYVVLGNEDWLLKLMSDPKCDEAMLRSLVAWSLDASRALAVKVVNPAGINAFKFNQRQLDLDQQHIHYGVTPRDVIRRLTAAVDELGLAHPLHLHASNLGMPGNISATLGSLEAAEGRRLHLTHAQFHCYSDQGPYGMSSGAEQLANYVNSHNNISLDVGLVQFGQTVTISADAMAQTRNMRYAKPGLAIIADHECQAGCGVVPMRYENKQYVHSLQWVIGLELMLLISDPWRVFLTTDHPNGGPFTAYPHLLRLLMDRSFRQSMVQQLHPKVAESTLLNSLTREYSLDEVAIITRAAPARILGLSKLGSLTTGCDASLAVYQPQTNWESTFSAATLVMKSGKVVLSNDQIDQYHSPRLRWRSRVEYDPERLQCWKQSIQQVLLAPIESLQIEDDELELIGCSEERFSLAGDRKHA
jgi:formylmethanofuran dehydrogenase subunit A